MSTGTVAAAVCCTETSGQCLDTSTAQRSGRADQQEIYCVATKSVGPHPPRVQQHQLATELGQHRHTSLPPCLVSCLLWFWARGRGLTAAVACSRTDSVDIQINIPYGQSSAKLPVIRSFGSFRSFGSLGSFGSFGSFMSFRSFGSFFQHYYY